MWICNAYIPKLPSIFFNVTFHKKSSADIICSRDIEMTPFCKIAVTLLWVLGFRKVHHAGGVDEQAGVQPS
jgi:hypothetical protein